jgi:acetyl esterase
VVTAALSWLFSHPEPVLALLGARRPVEVDGRVLNRSTQLLLELSKRGGGRRDPLALQGTGQGAGQGTGGEPVHVALRKQFAVLNRIAMPVRTDVHVTGRTITGPDGAPPIPIRVYRTFGTGFGAAGRPGARLPAIVFFHGGGWVIGDLDSHDASCQLLAAVSGCVVVAVDYRLAPEHPFPAAVEDAEAAYRWVHRHGAELGAAAGQVAVFGDSAGGNLAAVVALRFRGGQEGDDDVPGPVAQGLVYPATDGRLDSPSVHALGEGFFLTAASMHYFFDSYVPDGADRLHPDVSPLTAADHSGLAPALVVTAGFDPLRDDGQRYAAVLRDAGVEVEERCYDDQVHGFFGMGVLPDSLALATEVCDAMGCMVRRSVAPAWPTGGAESAGSAESPGADAPGSR